MDKLDLFREVYEEAVARRNAAIEQLHAADLAVGDARVTLKLAENQLRDAITSDDEIARKQKAARELYDTLVDHPSALLSKLTVLDTERLATSARRNDAQRIMNACANKLSATENERITALARIESISAEINQLSANMESLRAALN